MYICDIPSCKLTEPLENHPFLEETHRPSRISYVYRNHPRNRGHFEVIWFDCCESHIAGWWRIRIIEKFDEIEVSHGFTLTKTCDFACYAWFRGHSLNPFQK